jgi:diguanylate cyclase (GGDEF)-like protein/PAS domain S-box-containing protein
MAVMLLLLAVLSAATIVITFGFIDQQEADGIVINAAGRQRMLSQKMSKEAFAIAAGNGQLRTTLGETASEFDETLTDLLEGSAERGLPAAQGEVKAQLEKVSTHWDPFYEQVQVVQTAPVESPEFEAALAHIDQNGVLLLNEMNTAVGFYDDAFSGKINTLKRVVIVLAVVGALVTAVAWWLVFARLARPLSKLAEGAVRLGRGQLHHRVDVNTADEVGTVAREFNAMADRLEWAQGTLKQRAEQLEEKSTLLQRAMEALRESEEGTRTIIDTAYDAFISMDADGFITAWNAQAETTFGWSRSEAVGRKLADTIIPPQHREAHKRGLEHFLKTGEGPVLNERIEMTAWHQDGHEFPIELAIWPVRSREIWSFNAFVHDITERKRMKEALREQARRDPLTGVLNHAVVVEELRSVLSRDGQGAPCAVAMVDVDGMKATNDTYGHQVGDEVLLALANALSRDGAIVGRYGGDEFVAVLPGADRLAAERYCEAVLDELSRTGLSHPETGAKVTIAASLGLAIFPEEAETVADLIRLSDDAMYASRRQRPMGSRTRKLSEAHASLKREIAQRKRAEEARWQAQTETVMLLAAAAEAHDHTTGLHLHGVRALTEALAQEMGYGQEDARDLGLAAVLHDIGKVRVPDAVLTSSGKLADEEWELMRFHTTWGARFLDGRPGFELASVIARSHHERWDGSGYPDGLAGEDIPEAATIVAVADCFDAITSDRPYRMRRSVPQAIKEISDYSGKQFSPKVVEALEHLHQRSSLPLPRPESSDQQVAA